MVATSRDVLANSLRDVGAEVTRYDEGVLDQFAKPAAERKFSVSVADTFIMSEWRTALNLRQSGRVGGKLGSCLADTIHKEATDMTLDPTDRLLADTIGTGAPASDERLAPALDPTVGQRREVVAEAMCDLGVFGLATMGANLARNAARRGNAVAIYNRNAERTATLMDRHGEEGRFTACETIEAFVAALRSPRAIILSVASGPAIDAIIEQLAPLLDPGDILIDAGNSHFSDTERRMGAFAAAGLRFIGMGVSGGEQGALNGPSMMPGGSRSAYEQLAPILTKMAAQVDGQPCCAYVGPGAAGHYVKMVHNGIEYADMQAIAETYDILRSSYAMTAPAIADVFDGWRQGDLASYLLDIAVDVLRRPDERTSNPLVDQVLDEAAQTGTGRWTAADALELDVAATATSAAVAARSLSARRSLRQRAAAQRRKLKPLPIKLDHAAAEDFRQALLGARIVAFSQGFEQLAAASDKHHWRMQLGAVAGLWRGGCIIRAVILDHVVDAYRDEGGDPLVLSPWFRDAIARAEPGWRRTIIKAINDGIPVPVLSSSLAYLDGLRQERSPANLVQALRDEFGAHGYRRIGSDEDCHTDWSGSGTAAQ